MAVRLLVAWKPQPQPTSRQHHLGRLHTKPKHLSSAHRSKRNMKTLNSLRKDGHVTFCPPSDTSEAALPTNLSDATFDDIYLMLPQNHIRLLRLQNTIAAIDLTDSSASLQRELAVFSLDSVPS